MTSRDFCYWLQGFFELNAKVVESMDSHQVARIRNHLALVFKHEIDPSIDGGVPSKQQGLGIIHSGGGALPGSGPLIRC